MRILLTIAYDGTDYAGWQIQNNAMSVQEKLEKAISVFFNQEIKLTGASRTDSGVHAVCQKATFEIEELKIPIDKFCQVMNKFLPSDIVLQSAEFVSDEFHPRFSAKKKTYVYKIQNARVANPICNRFCWHIPHELDVNKMQEAAKHFIGQHDFAAFCASGGSAKTSVREIYDCAVTKQNDCIEISVTGNGFLYNMVRIISGTLMHVGLKKIAPEEIPDIIKSCDRARAGKTAPPMGLCLMHIEYEKNQEEQT